MTTQLLTGYTRVQMVLYFFEQHQTGNYSSFFITNYISNTFDILESKSLNQLRAEVCAVFSTIILHPTKHPVNMVRLGLKGQFLYTYINNQNLNMPEVKYVRRKRNTTKKLDIKPTQQSFTQQDNEEEIKVIEPKPTQQILDLFNDQHGMDENTMIEFMEEQTLPPLIEDIKNAESINNIQDPLKYLMEQIEKMNLPNLNQITLKQTINNREITITIS
jgi:hypothetical protein